MKKGLYILNYHNISWEDHQITRGIGAIFSPDVFWEHLDALNKNFKLVSVEDGLSNLEKGAIQEPQLAFWFDDGQPGVRKEALPAMDTFGVKGAMSVNSRFMLKEDFHWRFKVSLIAQLDGLRFLRSEMRKRKIDYSKGLKASTIDFCSAELLEIIDKVFNKFATDILKNDMYRLFDDVAGIQKLHDSGWLITNHTAAHFPVSEDSFISEFHNQFMECDEVLNTQLNINSDYWVLPFDRKTHRSSQLLNTFEESRKRTQRNLKLVLVGNQINTQAETNHTIHRIAVPLVRGNALITHLSKLK